MSTTADTRVCAFCGTPLHLDGGGVIWIAGLEYHTICAARLQAYGTGPITEQDVRRIVREELNTKPAPKDGLSSTYDPYQVTRSRDNSADDQLETRFTVGSRSWVVLADQINTDVIIEMAMAARADGLRDGRNLLAKEIEGFLGSWVREQGERK